MNEPLKQKLAALAERQNRLTTWCRLTGCWASAALIGLCWIFVERQFGWSSWLAMPLVILVALMLVAIMVSTTRPLIASSRDLARQIEALHPELEGRLLTAMQQDPAEGIALNYLQERLLWEALRHGQLHDWTQLVSNRRLAVAQAFHWVALGVLGLVLVQLRPRAGSELAALSPALSVVVTPGDTQIERGTPLVVLARFTGAVPPNVELVASLPTNTVRIPLVKSLADPMFGGTLNNVADHLSYQVEFSGRTTRKFNVTVFEYPRLQRADADLTFPPYTGEAPRHIDDTRRLSAVEGSVLDLKLQLNKPVVSAELISRGRDPRKIPLNVETNRPVATLGEFALETSQTYDLLLTDADGRTNKVPAQFVLEALKNRAPEVRLTSPRGDLRPSPLEEITFEGSVWDDFGVTAYGVGYAIVGQAPQFVALGTNVVAKQKQQFQHLLRLEELHVKPDELVSWFVWADDLGPDGAVRRTLGDLFFGEVRPFDEVFREGQGMAGGGEGQGEQGNQGGQTGRLAELQKQIISATWNLQRKQDRSPEGAKKSRRGVPALPGPESRNDQPESKQWAFGHPAGPAFSSIPEFQPHPERVGTTSGVVKHRPRHFGGWRTAMAQVGDSSSPDDSPPAQNRGGRASRTATPATDDISVIRESQSDALQQAQAAAQRSRDPRTEALWKTATAQMEAALANLEKNKNSVSALQQALAAEQAAYQALLRLQEHEYQVNRQRNRGQSGGGRQQQMQRQLEQMELTQTEDRYETQRQAQAPQNTQRREQLQVMNRLQELARRQQDLNERLKELQSALQEARSEEERAELQRRLKRLQEEEQQMLADVDELRQRMDRPENQSRMANERQQLDQTRQEVQRASEAAGQGAASQALAAGTRAERQLQDMRDQLRKENSSQFAEEMRSMRSQVRELSQRQQEIQKGMQEEATAEHRSLSDSGDHKDLLDQIGRQKELMTNLVDRATRMSQEAETSEPLLSTQLYDSVRKFSQDSAKSVKELQEELLGRGLMPGNLMESLKNDSQPEGAKLLDVTSEMLRRDFIPQASQSAEHTGARIQDLKRGVERAAESVLGDDTEALRLAQQQLDQLTDQLQGEIARAENGATNAAGGQNAQTQESPDAQGGMRGGTEQNSAPAGNLAQAGQRGSENARDSQSGARGGGRERGESQAGDRQPGADSSPGPAGQDAQAANETSPGQPGQGNDARDKTGASGGSRPGGPDRPNRGGQVGGGGGDGPWNLDRILTEQPWRRNGPLTGEDFGPWSDRLREVEEIIDMPDLRNEVAAARERARQFRQAFKRDRQKPDWAVVRSQVMSPLVQVRNQIAEELARRQSSESLVPIDRDPVPNRYSELVRRYYEELGKSK
jgi:hypothetical protein